MARTKKIPQQLWEAHKAKGANAETIYTDGPLEGWTLKTDSKDNCFAFRSQNPIASGAFGAVYYLYPVTEHPKTHGAGLITFDKTHVIKEIFTGNDEADTQRVTHEVTMLQASDINVTQFATTDLEFKAVVAIDSTRHKITDPDVLGVDTTTQPDTVIMQWLSAGGRRVITEGLVNASLSSQVVSTITALKRADSKQGSTKDEAVLAAFKRKKHYIKMPYFGRPLVTESGELIKEIAKAPFATKIALIAQLTKQLAKLHETQGPIIHRDIKGANILYKDGKVTLIDFGCAKQLSADCNDILAEEKIPGTYEQCAPEFIATKRFVGTKTDVYQLMPMIALILGADNPFVYKRRINVSNGDFYTKVNQVITAGYSMRGMLKDFPKQYSQDFKPLITRAVKRMASATYEDRQTMRELHSFFAKIADFIDAHKAARKNKNTATDELCELRVDIALLEKGIDATTHFKKVLELSVLLEKIFYTNHYPKEIKSFVVEFLKRMQDKHKNGTDVTDEVGVFFAKLKDFCRFWNEKSGFSIEQEVGLALLANGIQLDAVNKHLENAVRKLACNNLLTQKRIVKLIEKATIPSSSQPNPDATPVEDLASAMVHENNTQVKIFREVYNEHAPLAFFKTTFGRGEFYKGLNAERVENKIRDIEDIADHVVENPDGTGGVAVRALASSDRQDKTIWENMLAPGR